MVERQTRMLQAHVPATGVRVQIPFSAFFELFSSVSFPAGSFLISLQLFKTIFKELHLERWPSLVRHRTRNPASGLCSRAGSNPVLSFNNKQDMSYEAHVFSVILFLLLEGHLLGERSLLS